MLTLLELRAGGPQVLMHMETVLANSQNMIAAHFAGLESVCGG